jgi:hypothetical protein
MLVGVLVANRRNSLTEERIQKWLKEGRAQGN